MRRLILIRHAKSGWDNPLLADHDRPLAPRGRRAAPLVGRWLRQAGFLPVTALVSTARRTRETWELIAPCLPPAEVRPEPGLYAAAAGTILSTIREAGEPAETLAVVGHNPGIGDLAGLLAREAPTHPAFTKFPTAATLVLEFEMPLWSDLRAGTGQVAGFVVPRDLESGHA